MKYESRKALESIVLDLDKCLEIRNSSLLERIRNRIKGVLYQESINPPIHQSNGHITPCERVSYEKCLDRLDSEISRLKGQVSHDAWGPKYTGEQSILMKDLKASRKEIVEKLGLPC